MAATNVPFVWGIVALAGVMALSGCFGGDDGETSPTPTGTGTSPGPNATMTPAPAAGAEVYNKTASYASITNPAPTLDKMTLAGNYSSLAISVQIRKTGAAGTCAVLINEPPSQQNQQGIPPRLRLQPPGSGSPVDVALGTINDCNSPAGNFGAAKTGTASNPAMGDWTLTLAGRGQGISLEIKIRAN